MEKKFNLSEESIDTFKNLDGVNVKNVYLGCDVKEFIKRLKEKIKGDSHWKWTFQEIDKLAGDKLI